MKVLRNNAYTLAQGDNSWPTHRKQSEGAPTTTELQNSHAICELQLVTVPLCMLDKDESTKHLYGNGNKSAPCQKAPADEEQKRV
jgi:hypothetical protein